MLTNATGTKMPKTKNTGSQKPLLYFFQVADDKLSSEGVVSALQSFETAVMLIGYARWPSIIPLIWSACEALLRKKYPKSGEDIYKLQANYKVDGNVSDALNRSAHELRKLRNDINHKGFLPRDTPRCVDLFFNAGVPYLDHLLKNIIESDLFSLLYPKGGIWDVFKDTRKAVIKKKNKSGGKVEDALLFLMLKVRETFSPTFVPEALWDMQESAQDALWISEMKRRNELIDIITKEHSDDCFAFAEVFCPVCGENTLGSVHWQEKTDGWKFDCLKSIGCYKCGYLLDDADMIKIFFQGQLTRESIEKLESDNPPLAEVVFV